MLLWTVQPREVYEDIMRTGSYHFDATKNPMRNDFESAYEWLEATMERRGIKRSDPSDPLVWAWQIMDGKCYVSPYNKEIWSSDKDEVLLQINIPDEQVLLSDFDAWHYVLNRWYYDTSGTEEEWEENQKWFKSLPAEEQEIIKKASWLKCLDITPMNSEWRTNGKYVQATFFGLHKDQIEKVLEKGFSVNEEAS